MATFAILFVIAVAAYALLGAMLGRKQVSARQFNAIYVATLGGLVLIYLGITGRLNPLFSLLGVLLPWLVRGLPLFARYFRLPGGLRSARSKPASPGAKSEVNTRFLAMVLDHDSGEMDGKVLEGEFAGRLLSELDLPSVLRLLNIVDADVDSANVLRTYLDRHRPEWQQHEGRERTQNEESSSLSIKQAYEVLGLDESADRDTVRDAHRRLIGKVHPDHGGSDYLAARINEAKSVLLAHLGR